MKVWLGIVLLVLAATGCRRQFRMSDLEGTYVPVDFNNTTDTIRLVRNGVYQRVVYNVSNEMVLKMSGRWEFDPLGNALRLHGFYLNLDDDLASFPELVNDTSMEMNTIVQQSTMGVQFCVGYISGENCYCRVRD
jgi:hypothetical protein